MAPTLRGSRQLLPSPTPGRQLPARRRCARPRASMDAAAAGSKRLVPVRAEERLTVPVVREQAQKVSLAAYFALPVSQFVLVDMPLGAELRRVGADLFEVLVPRLEILGVWVQPRVTCTVRSTGGIVDIQSVALRIEGSDLVHRLRLNERVEFHVRCQFTPESGPAPAIHCQSHISALVDPPALFAMVPDRVLSSTASAVVKASLSALQACHTPSSRPPACTRPAHMAAEGLKDAVQRTFVPSLAADYAKWAASEEYRRQREQHAVRSDAALAGALQAGERGRAVQPAPARV